MRRGDISDRADSSESPVHTGSGTEATGGKSRGETPDGEPRGEMPAETSIRVWMVERTYAHDSDDRI
ncbi:hypothetical protein [Halorussus pelagicus]|uniref:hypothetical protein n=1 Tax=Halorussus pelagicus TaxID=2505977 RepID=UPI000FFBB392|nr:hypothetical protein [Halorussus pelagicus]